MPKSQEFQISDIPRLDGYVAIVTGGNSGIGYETTLQLAKRGARVYIASRSQDRVNQAIKEMQKGSSKIDVRFLKLDLEDLQSVKATAAEFQQIESRLDILINNAGIMASPYRLTKDGYEAQWQVCFLSHHALTLSLLPLLKATAALDPQVKDRVRIVNVSSELAIVMGPKNINYADPNLTDLSGNLAAWKRYGHAKEASIIAAKALNDRYQSQGITAYSLHPGVIKTGLQAHSKDLFGTITRVLMKVTPTLSPIDGASTSLYCATSPRAPQNAGQFFLPIAKVAKERVSKWLDDPEAVRKLWELANTQLKSNGYLLDL